MNRPPWTTSRLDGFETCPRQFYHVNVARDVKQAPNEASMWGDRVHDALEQHVKTGLPLPFEMAGYAPIMAKITALPGVKEAEQKIALDENFQRVDYAAPNAWTRGKIDLTIVNKYHAIVLDYKTGKRKLSEQLRLYAAYTFADQPQLTTVSTGFVWLRDRKIDKETIHRDQVPAIWQTFLPRVRKLESAYERDAWPARPSGLCKGWCPCTGCEFNGGRK